MSEIDGPGGVGVGTVDGSAGSAGEDSFVVVGVGVGGGLEGSGDESGEEESEGEEGGFEVHCWG